MNKKTKNTKKNKIKLPIEKKTNPKQTRVKKNRKNYGKALNIKNSRLSKLIAIILIISFLANIFTIYHFVSFNHNKVKEVIKVKKEMPERVVFIGDSITWMYDLKKYYGDDLYQNKYYLVNSGIDGATTEEILYNIENRVYQFNPKKVFILIGTNDINKNRTTKRIIGNIEEIIDNIKENVPNCEIYIESIYPINDTDSEKINMDMVGDIRNNDLIKRINDNLVELAKEKEITYIDMYSSLIDDEENLKLEYTREGLHISDDGYKVITEKLKEYLK